MLSPNYHLARATGFDKLFAFKLYIQGVRDTPQEFDYFLICNLNAEQLITIVNS